MDKILNLLIKYDLIIIESQDAKGNTKLRFRLEPNKEIKNEQKCYRELREMLKQ